MKGVSDLLFGEIRKESFQNFAVEIYILVLISSDIT